MGLKAVEALRDGISANMIGISDGKMIFTPLDKAIKGESTINRELVRVSEIMRL
jgi:6-phosphofructokinase 1